MKAAYLLFTVLLMSLSCTNTLMEDVIRDVNSSISGIYVLTSAEWKGQPVDLNDDGICNNDLILEFARESNMSILTGHHAAVVEKIMYGGSLRSRITIYIPLQNVSMLSTGLEVGPIMTYRLIDFKYTIDDKRNIIIDKPDYSNINFCDQVNFHFRDINDAEVISIKDGHIDAKVTVSYYDCQSKSFLVDTVLLSYSKVREAV